MKELYEPFVRTGNPILVMDPASAELTKYAANAMLATRISFMNEIANLCDQRGRRRAAGAARHGHGRAHRLVVPLPGHRLRRVLLPEGREGAHAHGARTRQRSCRVVDAVERVERRAEGRCWCRGSSKHLGALTGKVVAIWGLAFKPRTDDMREAPRGRDHRGTAAQGGATVRVYDPKAMEAARPHAGRPRHLLLEGLRGGRGRRRAGARDRVERVPRARLRAHQVADAARRRSSTAATSGARRRCASWASITRGSAAGEGPGHGRRRLHRQPRGARAARRRPRGGRARRPLGGASLGRACGRAAGRGRPGRPGRAASAPWPARRR